MIKRPKLPCEKRFLRECDQPRLSFSKLTTFSKNQSMLQVEAKVLLLERCLLLPFILQNLAEKYYLVIIFQVYDAVLLYFSSNIFLISILYSGDLWLAGFLKAQQWYGYVSCASIIFLKCETWGISFSVYVSVMRNISKKLDNPAVGRWVMLVSERSLNKFNKKKHDQINLRLVVIIWATIKSTKAF